MNDTVTLSAIALRTIGNYIYLAISCEGRWIEIGNWRMPEPQSEGLVISEIIEAGGIIKCISESKRSDNA